MFADSENDADNYVTKSTRLWLNGLTPLETNGLQKPNNTELWGVSPKGKAYTWAEAFSKNPSIRSKTFPGIARAMAEQWAGQAR